MRIQTGGEELGNSISHGVGFTAMLIATPILIGRVSQFDNTGVTVGAALFAAATALLYLASALYHALPQGRAKRTFRVIEHCAIFLLIAGTYTPFTLGVLRGGWGWTLFWMIWGLALAGVSLKVFAKLSHPVLSTGLYLAMGWLIIIAIKPLYALMPFEGFALIAAGGVAYTIGVIFFALDDYLHYAHFIWHLFVLAGNLCHFLAILWYAG